MGCYNAVGDTVADCGLHLADHRRIAGHVGGLLGALQGGLSGPVFGRLGGLGPRRGGLPLPALDIVANAQRPVIGDIMADRIGGRVAGAVLVHVDKVASLQAVQVDSLGGLLADASPRTQAATM